MSELAIMEDSAVVARAEEQLVTMTVEGQLFGLPILSVQDIVETDSITRVPLAPSAISGVMNLRGRIVTVVDLRRILGRDEYDGTRMGVTVEYQNDLYTILVDEIGEVRSLDYAAFEPPPATVEPALKQLCTGVYRLEDELLTVLDVERILASETIAATPPVQFIARRQKDAAKELVKPKTKRIAQSDKGEDEKAKAAEAEAEEAKPDVALKAGSIETKAAITKPEEPAPALAYDGAPEPADAEVEMPVDEAPVDEAADIAAAPKAFEAPVDEPVADAAPEPMAEPAPEPLEAEPPVAVAAVEQPLFDEVGGAAVVETVAKTFYEQALEDAVLGAHYADADLAKQQAALVAFLTNSLGDSPSLASGHEWLVSKKGMGDDGFNRCLELFEAALQSQNVPEGLIFLVLAAVERNRESIVD